MLPISNSTPISVVDHSWFKGLLYFISSVYHLDGVIVKIYDCSIVVSFPNVSHGRFAEDPSTGLKCSSEKGVDSFSGRCFESYMSCSGLIPIGFQRMSWQDVFYLSILPRRLLADKEVGFVDTKANLIIVLAEISIS